MTHTLTLFYIKAFWSIFLCLLFTCSLKAQQLPYYQLELGTERFHTRTFDVEPNPGGSAFPLPPASAYALDVGLGLQNQKWGSIGIGLGTSFFADNTLLRASVVGDFHPIKGTWMPFLRMRLGYSSLDTFQQENRQSPLAEGTWGLRYALTPHLALELQTGVLFTQQTLFIPIRIGCRMMPKK
ncbi:MAG: hypothetical protein ACXIT9_07790 [Nitritalea sp.]